MFLYENLLFVCFTDVNKWHRFLYILIKTVKVYQYGYQMKGLDLRVKNLLFVDRFCCFLMWDWSQRTPILQDFFFFENSCIWAFLGVLGQFKGYFE